MHDPADPNHVASYETGAPFRCLACEAKGKAQQAYSKALKAAQGSDGDSDDVGQFKWIVSLVANGATEIP